MSHGPHLTTTNMSYDDEPPTPIEDDDSIPDGPIERQRDYLPIGYQHFNRYKGSHVGLKQYTKLMRKVIAAMPLDQRVLRLKELSEVTPDLNPKLDQRKLAVTIELLTSSIPNEISNNNPT